MTIHTWWGADTAADFWQVSDQMHTTFGYLPTFVGRYLAQYAPAKAEIQQLHATNIGTFFVWNGASAADVVQNSFLLGHQHGVNAAAAALALGCPQGVFLPCDYEANWTPTAQFMAGYNTGVYEKGFVGGAYMDVLEAAHVDPWIAAKAISVCPAYIYSSEPELLAWDNTILKEWYDFSQTLLGPAHAGDVIVHQYWENPGIITFDLDLATDKGYSLMWLASNRRMTTQKCGLKEQPNHTCPLVMMIPEHGQFLDLGKRENGWAFIQYTDKYGWIPQEYIMPLP